MSDVLNLRKEVTAFNKSERFDVYSKIIINVSDDVWYEAGNDTGRTLTLSCPWGTQDMANNLLKQMRGFSYQPYTAEGAILNPASELGDGINVNGVYSGIYRIDTTFNSNCSATISAPADEEIDHEFQYKSKQEREVKRKNKQFSSQLAIHADQIAAEVEQRQNDVEAINGKLTVQSDAISAEVEQRKGDVEAINSTLTLHSGQITAEVSERKTEIESVKSTLEIQSGQISAKVNQTGGDNSTFGWELKSDSWTISAGSSTVLKVTKGGLEVTGKITATSGTIGGFEINNNYISYNNQAWNGTNTTGIYIGQSGIQLGNNFKVDANGNLTASSGEFTGYVKAANIKYGKDSDTGKDYGKFNGGGISSKSISGSSMVDKTISTSQVSIGIQSSLGYADTANLVFYGKATAPYIYTDSLHAGSMYYGKYTVKPSSYSFKDPDGNQVTLYYMGWSRT